MKIKLWKHKKEQVEVDVEFPIYRTQVFESSCIYTRINRDGSAVHVDVGYEHDGYLANPSKYEVEYEEKYEFDGSCEDYHLGKGRYSLTEDDFNKVVREAHTFFNTRLYAIFTERK